MGRNDHSKAHAALVLTEEKNPSAYTGAIQKMKARDAGRGDSRDWWQLWYQKPRGSLTAWSLLNSSPQEHKPSRSPKFSREAGNLELHEIFVKHWDGQTKLNGGWTWHTACGFANTTLHSENSQVQKITSFTRGKAGTSTELLNPSSYRVSRLRIRALDLLVRLLLTVSHRIKSLAEIHKSFSFFSLQTQAFAQATHRPPSSYFYLLSRRMVVCG
jgi:hypothetical protein